MGLRSFFQQTLLPLVIILHLEFALAQTVPPGHRIYSGDTSCICGIDLELLEKLETILKSLPAQSCPATAQSGISSGFNQPGNSSSHSVSVGSPSPPPANQNELPTRNEDPAVELQSTSAKPSQAVSPPRQPQPSGADPQSHNQINQPQSLSISDSKGQISKPSPKPSEENQFDLPTNSVQTRPPVSTGDDKQTTKRPLKQDTQVKPSQQQTSGSSDDSRENTSDTGFLNGLTISPISSHNVALAKLNQSSQSVDENDMASALESTVPNLVSNIFSNIKNLTMQTEQNPDRPQSNTLTSIDGSTMDVHGESKDQITADGEKLFDIWLEHQIETLNLTAAMAGHIRKSAGILFRRIIKQYVERVEKMGGKVEQNIQRATQMALNNTQTLIAFLLKNYINFAAGIMQILGEQVSRVGKQLDATGDTIAHMSLNPFDIISSVMESLPNPSDYSSYFRNFGKQLLGDVAALGNGGGSSNNAGSSQQAGGSSQSGSTQQGGLITKTIGAITKLGSWFG